MAQNKHADHDYIVARQNRYTEAWKAGSVDRLLDFMDPKELQFSNLGLEKENLDHSSVRDLFHNLFNDFHDLKMETRSLHGHKNFTAWEWVVVGKALKGPDGERLKKEEARRHKLVGCNLIWWNDQDKIIRNHEYWQTRDPDEEIGEGFKSLTMEKKKS